MRDTGYHDNDASVATGYLGYKIKADYIDMTIVYAAGGLYSTIDDLYRWDRALYTDAVVPQSLLATAFTPHIRINSTEQGYGYGWAIHRQFDRLVIEHNGGIEGFRTIIARYPNDQAVIIVLSNLEAADVYAISEWIGLPKGWN
jgi:CubicO group peptidase (beta-lactamase class C family)